MKALHIVNMKGGGIGTFLKLIERKGEIVWEREKQKEIPISLNKMDKIIIYGYIPDFDFKLFKNKVKIYFFCGLRSVSKRMILNRIEFNPLHIYKLLKFKMWLKNFDYYLSASFSMNSLAKKFYSVDSFVIHNGIDFGSMKEIKRDRTDNVLLWIGRAAWIKGLDRFLKLMELLEDYEGWILGVEGKNHKNVKFFGFVNDVYNYISKAKAVIITSYYESMSYVALESLYYGVPVLTLKSAGGAFEVLNLLGKYEWCFENIEDIANYIKNNEIEDYKRTYLFDELFNFENVYLRYKRLLETLK